MLYRQKPTIKECFRLGYEPFPKWMLDAIQANNVTNIDSFLESVNETIKIKTLEGVMTAVKGDYIIRGVKGEIYPCKYDIFLETYEYVPMRHIFNQDKLANVYLYLSEEHYLGEDVGDIIIADEDHKIYSEADEKGKVTKIIFRDKDGEDTKEVVLYENGERKMDRFLVPETFPDITKIDGKKVAYEFLKVEREKKA